MPLLDELKPEELYAMFKGEPGTRKSTQALSMPKPQYWFSVDQKMSALLLPMKKWGINPKDISYDDYTDYSKIRVKLEAFQLQCPFKTIVLDSITSIGDVTNRQTIRAKAGTTDKQGQEKGLRIGGIAVNSMEDYKAEAAAFNEIVALTKDIHSFHKVNVVLIAHVIGNRDDKNTQNPQTHFARIIVTGGKIISAKIPAYCEEVYHFNVSPNLDANKGDDYGIMTTHTGQDFARTSLPLEKSIVFGDNPLYETYLKPAIAERNK